MVKMWSYIFWCYNMPHRYLFLQIGPSFGVLQKKQPLENANSTAHGKIDVKVTLLTYNVYIIILP